MTQVDPLEARLRLVECESPCGRVDNPELGSRFRSPAQVTDIVPNRQLDTVGDEAPTPGEVPNLVTHK